jgi:hypothetical protein
VIINRVAQPARNQISISADWSRVVEIGSGDEIILRLAASAPTPQTFKQSFHHKAGSYLEKRHISHFRT